MAKETILPAGANKCVFLFAPMLTLFYRLWHGRLFRLVKSVIADINVGILYLFAVSSLGVWRDHGRMGKSNSKYAFRRASLSRADGFL